MMASAEWGAWMVLVDCLLRPSRPAAVNCPTCGATTVEYRFFSGDDRRGYGAVWCTTCNHGVQPSRLIYPLGVETIPLDSDQEVPSFAVVRP